MDCRMATVKAYLAEGLKHGHNVSNKVRIAARLSSSFAHHGGSGSQIAAGLWEAFLQKDTTGHAQSHANLQRQLVLL